MVQSLGIIQYTLAYEVDTKPKKLCIIYDVLKIQGEYGLKSLYIHTYVQITLGWCTDTYVYM